jgi:hypothetical protein
MMEVALCSTKSRITLREFTMGQSHSHETLTESAIAALDYITVYSHDFGLSESNLHGENRYRFGEFASRRATIKAAIKQLVLDRLVAVTQSSSGFHYELNDDGFDFASSLDTEYANTYYATATQVIASVGKSERTLGDMINQRSIASMRKSLPTLHPK